MPTEEAKNGVDRSFRKAWSTGVGTASFFLFFGSFPIYKYLAPPFGETHAKYIMGIFWASVIAAYFAIRLSALSTLRKMLVPMVWICFLCLIGMMMLDLAIVKSVYDSESKKELRVIVGLVRTGWANENYRGATDGEILRGNGATDQAIEKAWAPWSILLAKLLFGISFLGVTNSLFAIAMIHSCDPQKKERSIVNP
jgi:hypothetical protein